MFSHCQAGPGAVQLDKMDTHARWHCQQGAINTGITATVFITGLMVILFFTLRGQAWRCQAEQDGHTRPPALPAGRHESQVPQRGHPCYETHECTAVHDVQAGPGAVQLNKRDTRARWHFQQGAMEGTFLNIGFPVTMLMNPLLCTIYRSGLALSN